MATDVDVQYFSHLNGLTLGNNWGDLIRLLDKALVTGLDFTQITAASIDAQGDVHITLYSDHNAMLFQVVELVGFAPASLNQKYRIKGVPNTTQLILKPALDIAERSITAIGTGKLVSLGYEIIFRDPEDVKRVYRAKNPSAQHPFIRVDESLASPDGTSGIYPSTYAKFAMVGLLEHMNHIDDYKNPDVLQLPFDPNDPEKNWRITGSNGGVERGWSRWYYANRGIGTGGDDTRTPINGDRFFTLIGDRDAFYFLNSYDLTSRDKKINGCGLFDSALESNIVPNWFLMTHIPTYLNANSNSPLYTEAGASPLTYNKDVACFFTTKHDVIYRLSGHIKAHPIIPDYFTGNSNLNLSPTFEACLSIPFYDDFNKIRGTLKYINYAAYSNSQDVSDITPLLSDQTIYIIDTCYNPNARYTCVNFYIGDVS